MNQIKSFVQKNAYLKKVFATLCVLYGIGFLAIIRANFLYNDDMVRAFTGKHFWAKTWNRHGSDFLSALIHGDTVLSDISPLTQILAIISLALASTILIHIFCEKKRFSFLTCFAVLPLGLFPYFLECFSYKFDAPYMAFSVLAAVVPLLFCNYKDRKGLIGYGVACVLCGFFICITYQVSLGIFLMAVLFLVAKQITGREKNIGGVLKFIGISAAFYLIGILIFRIFLMKEVDSYASTNVLPLRGLLSGSISHLKRYYDLAWGDMKPVWKILIALIGLSYIVLFTLKSQTNKVAAFFVSVLVLLLGAVLSFPYILLDKPLFAPRAMYGLGALLALVSLQCCNLSRIHIAKILAFCLSWCFFSFAFEYGNALYQLKQWKEFRTCLVVADLNQIVQDGNKYVLQVSGSMGKEPSRIEKQQRYRHYRNCKILDRIVPRAEETPGLEYYIRNLFGMAIFSHGSGCPNLNSMDLPVLKETKYHTIKGDDEHILVLLK